MKAANSFDSTKLVKPMSAHVRRSWGVFGRFRRKLFRANRMRTITPVCSNPRTLVVAGLTSRNRTSSKSTSPYADQLVWFEGSM